MYSQSRERKTTLHIISICKTALNNNTNNNNTNNSNYYSKMCRCLLELDSDVVMPV